MTQSRSFNAKGRDSIVADYAFAKEGMVSIKKLFRGNAPAGEYELEACPFNAEGCPSESGARKVRWPAQPDVLWPDALSAGLYEIVRVITAGGISVRTTDRGLLLLAPRSGDGKSFKDFQIKVESVETTFLKDWTDKNEGQEMLSVFFLYLSGQLQK